MPEAQRPNALQLRKQLLLLESELNRAAVGEDLARIRESVSHLNPLGMLDRGQGGVSWWMKAAPVMGLLAGSVALPSSGWIQRGLRIAQLVAAAYPLWKAFTAQRSPQEGKGN